MIFLVEYGDVKFHNKKPFYYGFVLQFDRLTLFVNSSTVCYTVHLTVCSKVRQLDSLRIIELNISKV